MSMDFSGSFEGLKQVNSSDYDKLGKEFVSTLGTSNTSALITELLKNLSPEDAKDTIVAGTQDLPTDKRSSAIKDAVTSLPAEAQKKVIQELRGIGSPGDSTRDKLWLIVILGFAIVLVGSFLTIAVGMFISPSSGDMKTKPELVLTIFTSVVGFLAGLFVPSPAATANSSAPRPSFMESR